MNNYVKTSVPRPVGNPGNGINPKDVLTLIDIDDLVYFPPRDGAGVVLEGNIAVKPSAYSTDLYLTPGTVELSSNGEGETDAKGFTPSVKGKPMPRASPLRLRENIRVTNRRFVSSRPTGWDATA